MYHASIFKLRFNEELLNVKNELNQGCRIKSYTRISIKQMFDSVYILSRHTLFAFHSSVNQMLYMENWLDVYYLFSICHFHYSELMTLGVNFIV